MSKEAEARVRNELLQGLYGAMLRCVLARAGAGDRAREFEAVAAGVSANLLPKDVLLLPSRGGAAFRVLRGLAGQPGIGLLGREAGVLTLPRSEAQAVALAIGAATAAVHAEQGALVCVLLPVGAPAPGIGGSRAGAGSKLPETWADAGVYAARAGLPLLLISGHAPRTTAGGHLRPAPLYPSIPVDREDALAVYRVAFECVSRARAGFGPSMMRAAVFPGPGAAPDALGRVEGMLRQRGAFQKAWRRQLERQLIRELAG